MDNLVYRLMVWLSLFSLVNSASEIHRGNMDDWLLWFAIGLFCATSAGKWKE